MNDEDKYTEIELDKPRRLLLDLNAMADFEKATNKSVWDMEKGMTAVDLRALLWACLRHEEEDLSVHAVGAMVHSGNMAVLGTALKGLIKKSSPEEKKPGRKASPLA